MTLLDINKTKKNREFLNSIDKYVGARVRERRLKIGWVLRELAEYLGCSIQQLQKYEQGISRISTKSLLRIGEALGVSPSYFFEGYEETGHVSLEEKMISKRQNPLHVLIVEDDPSDELILREILESFSAPLNTYFLHDGLQALDFLRNRRDINKEAIKFNRPDIVLLDASLPKMNGLELLKEIKRDSELKDIPVIIMCYSLSKKDLYEYYRNQASGYISKLQEGEYFKTQLNSTLQYWSTVLLPHM